MLVRLNASQSRMKTEVLQPHMTVDFDFIKDEECRKSQNLREFHSKVGGKTPKLTKAVCFTVWHPGKLGSVN